MLKLDDKLVLFGFECKTLDFYNFKRREDKYLARKKDVDE